MKHLILASALIVPASVPASPGPNAPAPAPLPSAPARIAGEPCVGFDIHPAINNPAPRAQKLDELPPASLYLSVLRKSDGCYEPVIVRRGIGALADPVQAPGQVQPRR
jgi:hypothetical protein